MMFASTHPVLRRHGYEQSGRALERFLSDAVLAPRQPAPQYKQDESAFYIALDMPGVTREQLAVSIEGAIVRITSRENAPRNYRTALELPQEIDAKLSEAKLENGVLTLKLGKLVPVSNTMEIPVQ